MFWKENNILMVEQKYKIEEEKIINLDLALENRQGFFVTHNLKIPLVTV